MEDIMENQLQTDLLILGGGAAGLMAAVAAGQALAGKGHIVLAEHGPRVGKKLLSTGNGRCNLLNLSPEPHRYHGGEPAFIQAVLGRFTPRQVLARFEALGLLTRAEEEGRVYPYSEQASAVLDVLRAELDRLGVRQMIGVAPDRLQRTKNGYRFAGPRGAILARRVIVATGGCGVPSSGSDGSGHRLLKLLGHTITPMFPALCPVKVSSPSLRSMKGLRCRGKVTLLADGAPVKHELGEIQFADGALSGVCVFQLSRLAGEFFTHNTVLGRACKAVSLSLDLMPEYSASQVLTLLRRQQELCARQPLENLPIGLLNKRVGQTLLKEATGLSLSHLCGKLSSADLEQIAARVKDWRFSPTGVGPFQTAQVTAGGADCREFDPATLESTRCPGLYAAGEVLDVDGDCGGFNLYWAWCSGLLAGESAAKGL